MLRPAAALVLGAVLGGTTPGSTGRSYVEPRTASADRPFSDAVRVGDTVYLSGKLGLDAERRVPADPRVEARNALDSVKGTLAAAGLSMDDLVSVQVFCSDVEHYAVFNEVYRSYFTKELPARAFVGSGKLLAGARFEVQGIAARRP
jgi:reactive intermediate/imine deaminase